MKPVRPFFLAALFAFAFVQTAHAAEKAQKSLRDMIERALVDLETIEDAISAIDSGLARSGGSTDTMRPDMSAGSVYRDMKRASDNVADMGNDVQRLASKCSDDKKRAATEFRATTRRLQNSVRQVSSASNASFAQMSTSRVRTEVNEVRQGFGTLGEIEGCGDREDDDEESGDDDKPKEG